METTTKIADFIAQNGLKMSLARTDRNPNMDSRDMNHWKVTIRNRRRSMTLVFSQGFGIKTDPTLEGVLDCLASDAAGMENAGWDFENWATEYGYDTDSRNAERTFKAVEKQAERLKSLLGDDLYDRLLWHTERD